MVLETSFLPDIFRGILGWFFVLPVIFLAGSFCKKWVNETDEFMEGNIFFALGLGFIGTVINLLSVWNAYRPMGVIVMGLAIVTLRISYIGKFFPWFFHLIRFPFGFIKSSPLFGVLFLFTTVFSFLFALLPEIANDALTYHLNIPKELVWQKSTLPLVYDFNSYTPILMNVLYGVGLMFDSMAMAKLFHWFSGYIFVLSVFSVSLKVSTNRMTAFWISLLCFLTPTLLNEITSTYVDGAVCLFILLCFYLFHRALHEFENKYNFFIAGLLLGFAVSTKIIMLLALPALFLPVLLLCIYKNSFQLFLRILIFIGCGFAIATSFWFIRNSFLTGNPFFPYLGSLFGGEDYGFVGHFQNMGEPKSFLTYVTLPYDLTFHPEHYDRGYPLGFFLLFALPFSIYGTLKEKAYSYQLLFVWLFTTLWYYFFHNIRFLIPVLFILVPILAIGLKSFLLKDNHKIGWRTIAVTYIYSFFILLMFAYFTYHYRYQFKAVSGQINRPDYLKTLERSNVLSIWIDKHLPGDSKILNVEENRGFYIPRPTVREVWYSKLNKPWVLLEKETIATDLKEMGFTHVIRTKVLNGGGAKSRNRLRNFDSFLKDSLYARKKVSFQSQNLKEAKLHYDVYELFASEKK